MPLQNSQQIRVLLAGGGTGGHVFPLIAVARKIQAVAPQNGIQDLQILFVGPDHFAKEACAEAQIPFHGLIAGKLRRYFSVLTLFDLVKLPITLVQSLWQLYRFMPDVVFAKGGYGSAFPIFAAWLYRIPVVMHESDSVMGLTNRILHRLATRVILSFPTQITSQKEIVLGNPVREGVLNGNVEEGRRIFKISSARPVLFVQGGSQGAQKINELVINILGDLLKEYEIIHQTGAAHFQAVSQLALAGIQEDLQVSYHPVPFLSENEMADAYALSALVVSRAGAASIFEIALVQKPSILIPLSSAAQDHQKINAYAYADSGAAAVLEEDNLTPHLLLQAIQSIMQDEEKQKQMREQAAAFARAQAADQIAAEIFKAARIVE